MKTKGGPKRGPGSGSGKKQSGSRLSHMEIAASTLDRIERGSYEVDVDGDDGRRTTVVDLRKWAEDVKSGTVFFAEDDVDLGEWRNSVDVDGVEVGGGDGSGRVAVVITVTERSTLDGARALDREVNSECVGDVNEEKRRIIGVLSFGSAKNPGGGFLTGAQAQEESIARSSTVYPSLMTETGQRFYRSHRKNPHEGYYSHAMIYSPGVCLIRSDDGAWHEPIRVDVVTSCGVNAGVVRRYLRQAQTSDDESGIDRAMEERMGRVLRVFEKRGVRNLVLGSFGTGVFRNRIELVAGIWKDLLRGRFRFSFDRVEFAILGSSTYLTFKETFSDVVA